MTHATDSQSVHQCGGTVLLGGSGEERHIYCDRCGAYTYAVEDDLPTGCDVARNVAAYDSGDQSSPPPAYK